MQDVVMCTLEENLAALRDCGIHFVSRVAFQSRVREWGENKLQNASAYDLLYMIGSDFKDDNGAWVPCGEGIWHLDTECIYDAGCYVTAMNRLTRLNRGDLPVEDIRAYFEDTAWVRFKANGEEHYWPLRVNDDWIDLAIVERLDVLLRATESERRFCAFESTTQDLLLLCPTRIEFERLGELVPNELGPVAGHW